MDQPVYRHINGAWREFVIGADLEAYRTAADQDDIDAGFFDSVEVDGSEI
jgi:hypothetical protein